MEEGSLQRGEGFMPVSIGQAECWTNMKSLRDLQR